METKEEKLKEIAELEDKIKSSDIVNPTDMRKLKKLKAEIYGSWKVKKGSHSQRVTSFTKDRQ